MTFKVLHADRPEEASQWLAAWEESAEREVFAHPVYVALEAGFHGARALCAVARLDGTTVMYPFLLRDIDRPPGAAPCCDIASPYGYSGPAVWGQGSGESAAARFWACFNEWARSRSVVSEFVRFTLFPEGRLPYPGETWVVARHVVRWLQLPEQEIWKEVGHKLRKKPNRALRGTVAIVHDPAGRHLDSFLAVYSHTMDRRRAAGSYRYPRAFFERLAEEVPEGVRYFHAVVDDKIVSSELVFVSEHRVYSFLGGTLEPYFAYRPNDLLKSEIIRWARAGGKQAFVLGGGYQPDDGVFRYKLAFAPNGAVDYVQGGRVLLPDLYDALVAEHAPAANPRFFPRYRA